MPTVEICCGVQEYKLKFNGEESDAVEYGDPAVLTVGDKVYLAHLTETDDTQDRVSLLPDGLMVVEGRKCESYFTEYDELGDEDDGDAGDDDSGDEDEDLELGDELGDGDDEDDEDSSDDDSDFDDEDGDDDSDDSDDNDDDED